MVQSATFDRNGVSIDNTELKGKSVSVDCSEFIQEKLTDNTFGERLRKSRLELGLSIPEVDRKSTRLNSSHLKLSRMPSSA